MKMQRVDNISMMNQKGRLLISLLVWALLSVTTHQWCLKTTINTTVEVTQVDYSYDNSYFVVTSAPGNSLTVYEPYNYDPVLIHSGSGKTVQTARFSKNGMYLGVGYSDGSVALWTGRAPLSTTVLHTITPEASKIVADIAWNSASTKLLVCYKDSNKVYVMTNLAAATPTSSSFTLAAGTGSIECKFSAADDVAVITTSTTNKFYIQNAALTAATNTVTSPGGPYLDLDMRPSGTSATAKFVVVGPTDNKGYTGTNTASTQAALTLVTTSTGTINAACYTPDSSTFAIGGNDKVVWIFDDATNTNTELLSYSALGVKSCAFSGNSDFLVVGTAAASSKAYIYVYGKACYACDVGFYQVGPVGCQSCAVPLTGCSLCVNSTTCLDCFQGYFINSTSHTCMTCVSVIQGCSSCRNMSVCVECNTGFYLLSGLCVSCVGISNGCLSCNVSDCSVCQLDYYLNPSNKCVKCSVTNCQRCLSANVCVQCTIGHYLVTPANTSCLPCASSCIACTGSTASSCTSCMRGYYLTGGNTCSLCASNCLECNGTAFCLDCRMGTFVDATGTCSACVAPCITCTANSTGCLSCVIGFYLSGFSCLPCENNCAVCISPTNCSACNLGYYPSTVNTCLSCSALYPYCSLCSATACLACITGRYLNSTSNCSACSQLMTGCEVCNSSTVCVICAPGYYHSGGTANASCVSCSSNCQTCNTSAICTSCTLGYYYSSGSCLPCGWNCTACGGVSNCTSCATSYYLSGISCLPCASPFCLHCLNSTYCTSCILGYNLTANTCTACPSGCTHCNSTACLACNVGSFLSGGICSPCGFNCSQCASTTSCSTCDVGYFLNSSLTTNQCAPCYLIGAACVSCSSTACLSCRSGYYLQGFLCLFCDASVTRCLDCTAALSCLSCQAGYYLLSASSCASCSVLSGCLSCSSGTVCTLCASGYFLAGSTCSVCASKCASCITSATNCLTCAPTFYYNSTVTDCLVCETAMNGCEQCLNVTTCLSCSSGYYLSSELCLPCSNTLPACSLCDSTPLCRSCQQGFFLNSSFLCQQCSSQAGCVLCNSSSTCQLCTSGYYLATTTCQLCVSVLPGCAECSGVGSCVRCQSGYYLNGAVCALCQSILPGCIFCSSSSVCLQCEGGFYLSGGQCLACAQPGCQVCVESQPTKCVTCNSGYWLSVDQCLACPQVGCLTCNSTTCLTCASGYYLDGASCSLCSSSISGCSKCSSSSVCLQCQSLFFLNSSSCAACSSAMVGCSFCSSSSNCLTCDGGFYLSGTSCALCSTLPGCLICSSSSVCLSCTAGYYLSVSTCLTCSVITNCYTCSSGSVCTACVSGFSLSATGTCTAMQVSSGGTPPAQQPSDLVFKSFYLNSSVLKHVLTVKNDMKFQNTAAVNWPSTAKIYLENKATSTLLSVLSTELASSSKALIFYTNNPLSLSVLSMPLISAGRILVGQSIEPALSSSLALPQSALSQVLPLLLLSSDLNMAYNLQDPEFYSSYIETSYALSFYLYGLSLTVLLFLYSLMRGICYPHLSRHAQICGHLFALKTIPLLVYPTFAQFINFSLGFMTVDLPWLSKMLPEVMSQSIDLSPKGFFFYFSSMNFAAMSLITFGVFLALMGLGYAGLADPEVKSLKISTKDKHIPNIKFRAFKEVLLNFFCFGFAFAGFCSLIGSFLNASSIVSLSGMFYIVGVMIYAMVFAEAVYSFYSEKQICRLRLVLKASLLAAGSLNPIYLASVTIIADAILIIVEFQMRKNTLTCPKAWLLTNIFALAALISYFFVPDSLLTLILVIAFSFFVLPVEMYMFWKEKNISADILQNQPLSHTETSESDGNFWNLKAKADMDKQLMHSNEKIEQKKEHEKEDLNEQFERKREQRTTGFSNKGFEPKRRTRRFKMEGQLHATNLLKVQESSRGRRNRKELSDISESSDP